MLNSIDIFHVVVPYPAVAKSVERATHDRAENI